MTLLVFPFSKNKLFSLSERSKHQWITAWLKNIHSKLISDQLSPGSLDFFMQNYCRVLSWIGEPTPIINEHKDHQWWLEFISDCFHHHQKKTGLGLSEDQFLPKVLTGDKIGHDFIPKIKYIVALDNLRSAFNVGSILRVIDAVSFEGVISTVKTPGNDHNQVKKSAMGSQDWIPQEQCGNLKETLLDLKKKDYRIIGLETVENSIRYDRYSWPDKGVLVMGNEEYGISKGVLSVCDEFVHLPMSGIKNSINVANAFSVVAFQIMSDQTNNGPVSHVK
ncbi:MAG: hypothetical protein OEY59_00150 [Deltaproteobacteria bacterium]|nr:hypothetical protein [Deltaproteobacteria bacterium]